MYTYLSRISINRFGNIACFLDNAVISPDLPLNEIKKKKKKVTRTRVSHVFRVEIDFEEEREKIMDFVLSYGSIILTYRNFQST